MKIDILFEKIDNKTYFISNDSGVNLIISKNDFLKILSNKINYNLFKKLYSKGFLINTKNEYIYISNYYKLRKHIFKPPTLHIIVLTTKCNYSCVYCRAKPSSFKNIDMDKITAFKTIDFILSTPSNYITVEFQGGESLINWNVFENAVTYLLEQNKKFKKNLLISVVTNMSLMDSEKLKFLIKNNISICTSLDGPQDIHNANRTFLGNNSYKIVTKWIKKIISILEKTKSNRKDSLPSALMTTTRISLKRWKNVIDEYRKIGIGGIFIRPLSPIGYASTVWEKIGYSPKEFLEFYENSIDYILKINEKEKFIERNAAIKLKKLLFIEDPNYLDLRSPCGAFIGQIAYHPDGSIYSCDEGRMLQAEKQNFIFSPGNVFQNSYEDILKSKITKTIIYTSINDLYPKCSRCAFKPFCGICPVLNYQLKGTLINTDFLNYWCDIEKGIFKILIKKIKDEKNIKIFLRWFDA